MDHPHVHCLVTGGGLINELGKPPSWRGRKQAQYLFPVQAVAAMVRGKFMAGLKALRTDGALEFHGRLELWRDPAAWERTLGALRGTKWNVFGKGSVAGPESVLESRLVSDRQSDLKRGNKRRRDAQKVLSTRHSLRIRCEWSLSFYRSIILRTAGVRWFTYRA